jgi:transcriptional regulator with AAA-type ATPase domain
MSVDTLIHIVTADLHTLALSIRASCLVFEDLASRALLERVQQIASSDTTALIIGETGTVQLPPLRERPGDIRWFTTS